MKVPILRLPFTKSDGDWLGSELQHLLASGTLTSGPHTKEFEARFAAFSGVKHAVANASGTASLELILRALGIEGRSVIVPTNTFAATAFAVLHTGNRVIFADSDPATLGLDPQDVARRIEPDTAAVILVHIGGVITGAVAVLRRLCQDRGLALIEDCAHAHGCRLDGEPAGSLGCAGAFSFFPTKTLTTGEGGMVVTNDDSLAEKLRIFRNHGKNPALGNHISEPGSNYRISEWTALFGLMQMEKAEEWVRQRREIAAFYDEALKDQPGVRPLKLAPGLFSSYYKYILYLDEELERAPLKALLREKYEVSLTGEVYADPCHREPVWEGYSYCGRRRGAKGEILHAWANCPCDQPQTGFPGAEYISCHHLCLPLYPGLSMQECQYVVESLGQAIATLRGER